MSNGIMFDERPLELQVRDMTDDELISRCVRCWHYMEEMRRTMQSENAEAEASDYRVFSIEILRRMGR